MKMKRATIVLSVLLVLSMLLAACAPAAAPAAEEAEAKIAELEAQLKEAAEGAVSEEELAALQAELDAAKADAEAAMAEAEAEAAAEPEEVTYERSETLYTSGTQWGPPSNWNPFMDWAYATGTIGLCYETLFLYDPLTNEYIPWLAESGEWTSDTVYQVKLREGINWSDGEPLTSEDVVFTTELGKLGPSTKDYMLWEWLDSATAVDDYTVEFSFSEPLYQEWANWLYSRAIVPQHLWEGSTEEEVASGVNENPVGTGPYLYETYSEDRMVWVKNENWWAKDLLGLDVAPKRIVDIVNSSNNVALGLALQGGLDLSNNFLPGVATLVEGGYGLSTYYPDPPYMLAANTAWLVMNLTKAPMDDVAFRKAMAYAVDVNQIVEVVYGNIVSAADPTGMLEPWAGYVDQAVVDELGFSYDPDKAKSILANAGYVDTDGDGFVEALDGSSFALKIIVPFGWTDWMESVKVIANGAQAVGINLEPDYPDYGGYVDQRNGGTFDMLISNEKALSNTPWTYYDWMFQDPILDTMTQGNYGRYENQEAFDLVVELDKTRVDDIEGMKAVISKLQRIHLEDMPLIPLWYNGMWAQMSSAYWTNWPSSAEDANHYLPTSWGGYWNMTAILMLTELEPVPAE
jgi:peptide/nickel transport system substrate-binding protein